MRERPLQFLFWKMFTLMINWWDMNRIILFILERCLKGVKIQKNRIPGWYKEFVFTSNYDVLFFLLILVGFVLLDL